MDNARKIKLKTTFPIAITQENTGLNETTITIMTVEEGKGLAKLGQFPHPMFMDAYMTVHVMSSSTPDVRVFNEAIERLTELRDAILAKTKDTSEDEGEGD